MRPPFKTIITHYLPNIFYSTLAFFQAVLIIRYSGDGKLYLYDIQNIKKETRYPSWTKLSDGQKPASSEKDYNTSQNELQEKVLQNKKETSSPPEQ